MEEGGIRNIFIVDVNGKTVKQLNLMASNVKMQQLEINVQSLKAGTYILKVITQKSTKVSKFVKL